MQITEFNELLRLSQARANGQNINICSLALNIINWKNMYDQCAITADRELGREKILALLIELIDKMRQVMDKAGLTEELARLEACRAEEMLIYADELDPINVYDLVE